MSLKFSETKDPSCLERRGSVTETSCFRRHRVSGGAALIIVKEKECATTRFRLGLCLTFDTIFDIFGPVVAVEGKNLWDNRLRPTWARSTCKSEAVIRRVPNDSGMCASFRAKGSALQILQIMIYLTREGTCWVDDWGERDYRTRFRETFPVGGNSWYLCHAEKHAYIPQDTCP